MGAANTRQLAGGSFLRKEEPVFVIYVRKKGQWQVIASHA
jgi:hypothetical protein